MKYVYQNKISKIIAWLCTQIATLGPIGYLPAPGTMGTLCAIPLLVWLRRIETYIPRIDEGVILALLIFVSVWIINRALVRFDEVDPSEIILDEVMGFFVTMLFMPMGVLALVLGFVYFRFFDIFKPFYFIQRLETIGGGWGIMLDDLAAALCARICMDLTFLLLLR